MLGGEGHMQRLLEADTLARAQPPTKGTLNMKDPIGCNFPDFLLTDNPYCKQESKDEKLVCLFCWSRFWFFVLLSDIAHCNTHFLLQGSAVPTQQGKL